MQDWRELRDMDSGKLLGTVSPDGRYLRVKRGSSVDALVDLHAPVGPRCLSRSERHYLAESAGMTEYELQAEGRV